MEQATGRSRDTRSDTSGRDLEHRDRPKVSEFPAVYDFGGSRVAISEDGRFVVTAAYSRPGVHAYRVSDGERMWISGRSRKAQRVAISGDCKRVFVCYNSAPMAELDAADGTVMTLASGVERIVVSPHTNHAVENRAHKLFLVRPGKDIEIGLQGPVMAAFARSECAFDSVRTTDLRCSLWSTKRA